MILETLAVTAGYNGFMALKHATSLPFVQPYRYPSPHIPLSAIRRFARQIGERFQPDKIILFGSYAYGSPHAESDVDLLVVMPASNELSKSARITRALEPPFALDLIVRTPQHVERGLKEGDWLLREVVEKGKVVYEAADGPMGAKGRGRFRQRPAAGDSYSPAQRSSLLPLSTGRGKVSQGGSARTRRRRSKNS
jgi:predicted nucleotidyltransferase